MLPTVMKKLPYIIFVTVFFVESFCSDDHCKEITSLASTAINEFMFDLINVLPPIQERNHFLSSFSIAAAIAMTRLGARKDTLREIEKALHINDVENATSDSMAIDKFFKDVLRKNLEENPNYSLNLANRLFVQENFTIRQEFLQDTEKYYNSSIGKVDFGSGKAEGIVNEWVEKQTKNKIKNMFAQGSFSSDTVLALVNAIYFKGKWKYQFDRHLTEDGEFHLADNKKKIVQMMSRSASFPYFEDEDLNCQVLKMFYLGNDLSMLILLPKEESLAELVPKLNAKRIKSILSEMDPRQVEVKFPKFKLETKYKLKNTLELLGIKNLFNERADLTGLSDAPLKVSSVVHKAFVEINERGTEAAAATGVVVNLKSMPTSKPVQFVVNKPFFFVILNERFENVVLFTGTVVDPE